MRFVSPGCLQIVPIVLQYGVGEQVIRLVIRNICPLNIEKHYVFIHHTEELIDSLQKSTGLWIINMG